MATRSSGDLPSLSATGLVSADISRLASFVGDIYTELILRFARSINSASGTLFKAKLSPWAKGGPGKKQPVEGEQPEVIDTEPKKLEWVMTPELKLAVVSPLPAFVVELSRLI